MTNLPDETSKAMNMCTYCKNNQNPFKYGYMPLWLAWRPVRTNNGIAFLKKVHARIEGGSVSNLVGTYPVLWNEYYECEQL